MTPKVTREEIMALFFPERVAPPKPEPKVKVVSSTELSIEVEREATRKRLERLAEAEKAEARRAEEEARALKDEERQREQWIAFRQAQIDACWERQLMEKEIAKAWRDPMGLYGPPTLASPLD